MYSRREAYEVAPILDALPNLEQLICKGGKSFTYNSDINIAVAVAINGGLITPILQDADKMDLYLLFQKWKELVDKARSKQLQPHEYSSETFTLSSLGMFEVDRFDAILLSHQGLLWMLELLSRRLWLMQMDFSV